MGWQDEAQLVSAAPPMLPSEVSPSWMQQASLVAPAPSGTSAASASGIFGAIQAGYQSSATGLAIRGKLPDVVLDPQHSKWYERILAGASELVSEAPEMIAGGLGGGIAGSVGGPVGTLVGGGAGAFALPAAIRESLMQAYSKGAVQNSADFLDRASIVLKQTGKAGLIGAATAGAGGVAARVAGKALAPEIGFALSPEQAMTRIGAAQLGAEYGTMVVAPAALEGKLPEPEDFLNAAILIGGLKGALAVSGKLRSIYSATGVPPEQVFAAAQRDPKLRDELNQPGTDIPAALKPLADAETMREALPGREAEDLAESPFRDIPQPEGEAKLRGHVNYDYLTDREQLGPVAAAIADAYDRSIDTRAESWTESNAKAEQLLKQIAGGERPISDVVGWMPGQASLTAKVRAATDLLNGALTRFRATADAFLAKGEDVTEQDIEQLVRDGQRAGMIAPAVINDRAEMGRAFNILKETQGSAEAASLVQKILSSYDGDPTALAKAARDMPTPAALSRLARKLTEPPTTMQKIQDIWKAGLLSGTKTYMVKAIGDAVNIMAQFPERAVAAVLGATHGGEKVTPSEIAAYTFSMLHGTRAALRQGVDAWNGVGPFEHRDAIGGVAGKIVSIPHRIMSSETEFFRGLNEAGELGALAHRQAVKEGLIPGQDEFRSRVQSLMDSPTPEIQAGVKLAGDQGTYMQKLGQLGQAFQQLSRTTVGGFVVPFVRVPANLVKWGVRRMPGVAMMLDDVRADLATGGAKRDLALARQAVGGALGYLAYQAVQDGILTGGGVSFTPEERRSKAAAGWQPYSLKIDGKWYSYNRFEPLAKVAMIASDLAEMNDRVEGDDKASLPMLVAAMFGHATISETYLSGLNGLMQAMTDPKEHGAQWAHQFLGSAVPAILAQSASASDPHKRVVDDWLDAIKSRLPGLRQTLTAQVNPLTGKPVESNATMAPVNVSKASDDPVLAEAARLGVNVTHAPKNLQAVKHGTGKLGQEELTAAERAAFDTAGGKLAHEILSEVVGAPGWDGVPDLIQKKIFARVLTQAHRYAASQALTPEKRAAYIEQISEKLRDELTQ